MINLNARGEFAERLIPVDHMSSPGSFFADQCLNGGYTPTALWPYARTTSRVLRGKEVSDSGKTVWVDDVAESIERHRQRLDECPNCRHPLYYPGETMPTSHKRLVARRVGRVTCDGALTSWRVSLLDLRERGWQAERRVGRALSKAG